MVPFNLRKSARFLGVDISSGSVKLLELSRQGLHYRVERYAVAPLISETFLEGGIKDAEVVAEAVKLAHLRSRSKLKKVAIAVPGSSVITNVVQLDAGLDPRELEAQIELEAARCIPYPLEEVSFDFEVIEGKNTDSDKIDVLVVASRTENVDIRIEALEMAGLGVQVVDVESYAVERALPFIAESLPDQGVDKTIAMIDVGSLMTTITIFHNMKTVYTREEVFGGRELTESIQRRYGLSYEEAGLAKKRGSLGDDYVPELLHPFYESLSSLIQRSLQFFFSASEFSRIDHIVLGGGCSFLPGLQESVGEHLGVTISQANVLSELRVSPRADKRALTGDALSLMNCLGLAMRNFDHA